ncbi:MAG: TrmB family transcriptional regulator [Nitrososphaerales archaeon]
MQLKNDEQINLEKFGLSDYEAKAYIALVEYGPLKVGDIAYHSTIPRSKSYPAVKSLAKKRLAIVLEDKPLTYQAISPDEALEKVMVDEENQLKSMRRTIFNLKKLSDSGRGKVNEQEGRHLILSKDSVPEKLEDLVASSRSSIKFLVDNWGLKLIEELLGPLRKSSTNNDVEVTGIMGLDPGPIPEFLTKLSGIAKARVIRYPRSQSIFLFDHESIMLVNATTASGMLVKSRELAKVLEEGLLERIWSSGLEVKHLLPIANLRGGDDAFDLLDRDKLHEIFIQAVSDIIDTDVMLNTIGESLIKKLEEQVHLNLFGQSTDVIIPIVTELMAQSLGDNSTVRYDPVTRLLSVEMRDHTTNLPASIWLFILAGVLQRSGEPLEIIQNVSYPSENLHVLQAKVTTGMGEE